MLLLFSVRVAEITPVWERVVYSVLSCIYQPVCALLSILVLRIGCGI